MVFNSTPFYSQRCPSVDDKFFGQLVIWSIEYHSHICVVGRGSCLPFGLQSLEFPQVDGHSEKELPELCPLSREERVPFFVFPVSPSDYYLGSSAGWRNGNGGRRK